MLCAVKTREGRQRATQRHPPGDHRYKRPTHTVMIITHTKKMSEIGSEGPDARTEGLRVRGLTQAKTLPHENKSMRLSGHVGHVYNTHTHTYTYMHTHTHARARRAHSHPLVPQIKITTKKKAADANSFVVQVCQVFSNSSLDPPGSGPAQANPAVPGSRAKIPSLLVYDSHLGDK